MGVLPGGRFDTLFSLWFDIGVYRSFSETLEGEIEKRERREVYQGFADIMLLVRDGRLNDDTIVRSWKALK